MVSPVVFLPAGLSPPVRGNPDLVPGNSGPDGSIPARAGEPRPSSPSPPATSVYPRPCGGTVAPTSIPMSLDGLSPPVRGNRAYDLGLCGLPRSIPARAGEPPRAGSALPSIPVYPRPCGGTTFEYSRSTCVRGLSPPVRGNHHALVGARVYQRSIPARAGEPPWNMRTLTRPRVYPRPCGGTAIQALPAFCAVGLSPPVRGNPRR